MTNSKTILLVDDDESLRLGMQTVLREHGYETLEAEDGVEAKDLICEYSPDLVILDMMMPRWGGFAVLEYFENNPLAPPFIMLSAHDGAKHQAYAKKIGAVDFLHKPHSMKRLLQKIDRFFQTRDKTETPAELEVTQAIGPARVLLVEVHAPLARVLKRCLEEEGFAVEATGDPVDADRLARSFGLDVVVLDLMMPKFDGLSMLASWRKVGIAADVLALTAKDTIEAKVNALDVGADACMSRPFQLPELLARLRALVRRRRPAKEPVLRIHDLEIDPTSRIVKRAGQRIALTPREFALLQFLATRAGKVVTRTMIWESLYNDQKESTSNLVDVYIRYLRVKLDNPFEKKLILTRWGEGYLLRGAAD